MRRDDLDLNKFRLLPVGTYRGHVFNLKSHLSKPKAGTEEQFDMYLFEVRVDQNEDATSLENPCRIFHDTWPNVAAGIKKNFIPDDKKLKEHGIEGDAMKPWKEENILGRPCLIGIAYRTYRRRSGESEFDEKTGEEVAIMEDATAYNIKYIKPDFDGKILSEGDMNGMDASERKSVV